jgi:epoxyqueuosine reductase QueG
MANSRPRPSRSLPPAVRERIYRIWLRVGRGLFGSLVTPAIRGELGWVGRIPTPVGRQKLPPPWRPPKIDVPDELRGVAGVPRDPAAEQAAFDDEPLHMVGLLYPKAMGFLLRTGWSFFLPAAPSLQRAMSAARRAWRAQPAGQAPGVDPAALTEDVRKEARRLGISTVGFAPFDEKYIIDEFRNLGFDRGTVIVAVLEQRWEETQTIPSRRAERHAMHTYAELVTRSTALAEFLHERGFRAQPHSFGGYGIVIHFAVQAGLGQLGLNGQLLTPEAGSRCRIVLITTNAPLVSDGPRDYGIHRICDECQICVKRCPPGAIPNKRSEYRGVVKAKIKIDRCLPVHAQAHGCAVCMKVCPVQRFGLRAVSEHLMTTGEILGKGTDELEGYHWIDGSFYGAGQKPRMSPWLVKRGELDLDPGRKRPVGAPGSTGPM